MADSVKMDVVGGATAPAPGGPLMPFYADKGDKGDKGDSVMGPNGWTPMLAGELDGNRTLIKVVDWTGGAGVKPAINVYISTSGYVNNKANAFNFNAAKRVLPFAGVTNAQGIATIDMSGAAFANPPVVIPLPATTTLLSGPTRSTIVASSTTKTQTQIKVEQQALLTSVVSLLVGATANILVIEV